MRQKAILIIEDDPDIIQMIELALRPFDYTVLHATNGRDGLAIIERKRPQLVILDLALPYIRGEQILQIIRKTPDLNHTKVIVISSQSHQFGLAHQADAVFAKPYHLVDFRQQVTELLVERTL